MKSSIEDENSPSVKMEDSEKEAIREITSTLGRNLRAINDELDKPRQNRHRLAALAYGFRSLESHLPSPGGLKVKSRVTILPDIDQGGPGDYGWVKDDPKKTE